VSQNYYCFQLKKLYFFSGSTDTKCFPLIFRSDDQLQLQSLEPISLDDIPEPIKVLDEIISEFEEAATKPVALHSNSGENQSEDDGYMSLSRKKWVKYMDIKIFYILNLKVETH